MTSETPEKILIVDDNPDSLYAMDRLLRHQGYEVLTAQSGTEVLDKTRQAVQSGTGLSLILLDVMMPLMDGLEVTRELKRDKDLRYIPVILLTAKSSLEDIVSGLDSGADGYLTKPFKTEELLARIHAALRMKRIYQELRVVKARNEALTTALSGKYDFSSIVGKSPAIKQVLGVVEKVAPTDSVVLILGPSGTGKELIARALHFNSPRKEAPFVAKNCAAFSEHLLESELFGHIKGAFTGAVKDHQGLFSAADGGTLFLDEIGELPQVLQAKLLRVLQEKVFTPVGSTEEQKVNVRVVTATNRNLEKMVEEGRFREDLYYRLNVISINLPALSERREDIPLLVEHFLSRYADEYGAARRYFSEQALDALCEYSWRGNIRELQNEVERAIILSEPQGEIGLEVLSPQITKARVDSGDTAIYGKTLNEAVEALERKMITAALTRLNGNKSHAAKELDISRSSLIGKVQQYGINVSGEE